MTANPIRRPRLGAPLVVLALLALSCGSTDIKITLSDPERPGPDDPENGVCGGPPLRNLAVWAEFDIFEGTCPAEDDLANGSYGEPLKRQIVQFDEETGDFAAFSAPGSLAAKQYGFAVLLRQEDCAIVGYGCTKANLEKVREIKIKLNPTFYEENTCNPQPAGGCAQCTDGQCPTEDGGGGDGGSSGEGGTGGDGGTSGGPGGDPPKNECKKALAGASGCKMEIVAVSELPKASASGAKIGGPTVISTGSGFLVAYNEMLPDGTSRNVYTLPMQADGCYGAIEHLPFGECKGKSYESFEPTMAGAWNSSLGSGMLGFSRPPCLTGDASHGGGFGLVQFDGKGGVVANNVIDDKPTQPSLKFSQQGALSQGADSEQFRVSFVRGGVTQSFPLLDVAPQPGITGIDDFFGAVAGDNLVSNAAFSLTAREGGLFVNAAGGTLKDGSAGSMLRVVKGAASYFKRPAAKEMALRVAGNQIVTVGRSMTDQIEWAVIKDDGTQFFPSEAGTNSLVEASSLGFDAAVLGDRAFVAVGKAGGFRVYGFSGLSSSPAPTAPNPDYGAAQFAQLAKFDGKQIAMAAGSGRVVVAWVSQQIATTEPVGGVAVFKCE